MEELSENTKKLAPVPQEIRLYPWQKECLRAWQANDFHGIVNVITGGGKTVLALAAALRLKACLEPAPLHIKIVVPSVPLAFQWADALKKTLPALGAQVSLAGFYYSGQKGPTDREYMIYVLNSARHALARHILTDMRSGCHVLLIADECHHCTSPENRKIFDFLKKNAIADFDVDIQRLYHSLGLSATPYSTDYDTVLVPALGKEIYHYSFAAAVRDGTVCSFSIYQIALSFSAEELAEYADLSDRMNSLYTRIIKAYPYLKHMDRQQMFAQLRQIAEEEGEDSPAALYLNLSYKRKTVNCLAASRVSCALSLIERLECSSKILIFGERIDQAEQVYQALSRRYPNRVGHYHSQMTTQAKKNTLAAYRDGTLRILVSCRGLDEGVDVPEAGAGIILSGSAVNRQRLQRLGRILRRREGKSGACLYYLYIQESTEDSVYLADQEGTFTVCSLSYSAFERDFFHPAYEDMAVKVLEEGQERGLSEEQMSELRLCLLTGIVRPDWLESPELCSANIKASKGRREKNYWICMKKMAGQRRSLSSHR